MEIDHPTTTPDNIAGGSYDCTVLVLVGPPASGKSTIKEMLGEHGATTATFDGDIDALEDALVDVDGVCCIDGVMSPNTVDVLRGLAESVLVVHVRSYDPSDHINRYIEREIQKQRAGNATTVDDRETILESYNNEVRSMQPFPVPDIVFENPDEMSAVDIAVKCDNLMSALS